MHFKRVITPCLKIGKLGILGPACLRHCSRFAYFFHSSRRGQLKSEYYGPVSASDLH